MGGSAGRRHAGSVGSCGRGPMVVEVGDCEFCGDGTFDGFLELLRFGKGEMYRGA